MGLGLATAAPFFAGSRADLVALNFLVLAAFYGWAVYRFRSRFWLLTALLAVHLSLGYYLEHLDLWWFAQEGEAWLRFLPLTAALTATGLFLEKRLNEGSPLRKNMLIGWSRPFYLFVFFDVFFSQLGGLRGSYESAGLSLGNTLIVAVLASAGGRRGWHTSAHCLDFPRSCNGGRRRTRLTSTFPSISPGWRWDTALWALATAC